MTILSLWLHATVKAICSTTANRECPGEMHNLIMKIHTIVCSTIALGLLAVGLTGCCCTKL